MARRTRVYLSHPITGSGDARQNMKQIARLGMELRRRGYAPFVPSAGPSSIMGRGMSHEAWMECDLPYVLVADALVRMPGESPGADAEVAYAESLGIPVYYGVEALYEAESPQRSGDEKFEQRLLALARLHELKARDYGSEDDSYANVRSSAEFGVPAWIGALVRLNDKVTRLKQFARRGSLANESAVDSMRDIAVYAVIAEILYGEAEP